MNNILLTDNDLSLQVQKEIKSPHIDDVLRKLGPMPANGLFLGMCDDGMPVFHDLDVNKNPYMICASAGWGKTHLLKVVLRAALCIRTEIYERVVCPVVLTNNLDEWNDFRGFVETQEITQTSVYIALQAASIMADKLPAQNYLLTLIDGWEAISPELQNTIMELLPHKTQLCTMIATRVEDCRVDAWRIQSGYGRGHFRTLDREMRPLHFFVPGLEGR